MKPTIGRIVIYTQAAAEAPVNATREHPAMITRVHNDDYVNLMVFFDGGRVAPCTSVYRAGVGLEGSVSWDWPKRD
jgi:hypothetical protein